MASIHSALNGLFSWLYLEGEIDANPMLRIKRPRRLRPEYVAVVTVTRAEVEKMLAATEGWQEFLCLSVLAYTGVRRDVSEEQIPSLALDRLPRRFLGTGLLGLRRHFHPALGAASSFFHVQGAGS